MKRAGGLLFVAAVAAVSVGPSRGQTVTEKLVKNMEMLHDWPCINVMTLQDEFSRGDATNFELALSWHSYAQGVGDILYPAENDRFTYAMAALFNRCLEHPTDSISEIGRSLLPR